MSLLHALGDESPENLLAKVEGLMQENLILRQQLDYFKRQLFGSKSEKLDPSQLNLFEESGKQEAADVLCEPAAPAEKEKKATKPRGQRRDRLPENLPVRREELIPKEVIEKSSSLEENGPKM